jgi:glycosyltransferase involved in cell wall biosynthesis
MSKAPFFSVVVPTYNRVGRLLNTITTILKQTFTDFELLIIDDGSTDGTESIVKNKFSDNRLRVIRQINSERGAARNNGFRNASGEYVVFFDSDDIMHENHLQVLHDNIIRQNHPHFIATKFDFTDDEGHHRSSDMSSLPAGWYDYHLFLNGNSLACNVCVKKNIDGLIPFEEDRRYAIKEDWLFLISNMKTHKLFIVDDTTISMLDHPGRSMRSDNSLIISRTILAMDWILEKIKLDPVEIKQIKAHVNYFCGIHSYLDNNRRVAVHYSKEAISYGGFKMKYITLLVKSMIGRKIVSKIK